MIPKTRFMASILLAPIFMIDRSWGFYLTLGVTLATDILATYDAAKNDTASRLLPRLTSKSSARSVLAIVAVLSFSCYLVGVLLSISRSDAPEKQVGHVLLLSSLALQAIFASHYGNEVLSHIFPGQYSARTDRRIDVLSIIDFLPYPIREVITSFILILVPMFLAFTCISAPLSAGATVKSFSFAVACVSANFAFFVAALAYRRTTIEI